MWLSFCCYLAYKMPDEMAENAATSCEKNTEGTSHGLDTDFIVGEHVLCYDPDQTKAKMLYEAKIMETDITKDEKGKKVPEYFIHFIGWNKSWDRWVIANSVLKASEANKALQTKLYNQAIRSKRNKRKAQKQENQESESFDTNSHTSYSSINSSHVVEAEDSRDLPLVSIRIPHVLKLKLEDDCYLIKRKKKLLKLPRVPSARKILDEFWDYCQTIAASQSDSDVKDISLDIVSEVIQGLQTYLDFSLSNLLLYNFEMEQYKALFPSQKSSTETMERTLVKEEDKMPFSPRETKVSPREAEDSPKHLIRSPSTASSTKRRYRRRRWYMHGDANTASKTPGTPESGALVVNAKSAITTPRPRGRPGRKRKLETRVLSKEASEQTADNDKNPEALDKANQGEEQIQGKEKIETAEEDGKKDSIVADNEVADELKESQDVKLQFDEYERKDDLEEEAVKARTLRPRRSALLSRSFQDAAREQASLPIGATAKTMNNASENEKETGSVYSSNEKDAFMSYPFSVDQSQSPADIYGAEHLLRLFVKLPALLAQTDLEHRKLKILLDYLQKFLKFMAERAHAWFSPENYTESAV